MAAVSECVFEKVDHAPYASDLVPTFSQHEGKLFLETNIAVMIKSYLLLLTFFMKASSPMESKHYSIGGRGVWSVSETILKSKITQFLWEHFGQSMKFSVDPRAFQGEIFRMFTS